MPVIYPQTKIQLTDFCLRRKETSAGERWKPRHRRWAQEAAALGTPGGQPSAPGCQRWLCPLLASASWFLSTLHPGAPSTKCCLPFHDLPKVSLIQNQFLGWLQMEWAVDAKAIPQFSEGLDRLTLCGLNNAVMD